MSLVHVNPVFDDFTNTVIYRYTNTVILPEDSARLRLAHTNQSTPQMGLLINTVSEDITTSTQMVPASHYPSDPSTLTDHVDCVLQVQSIAIVSNNSDQPETLLVTLLSSNGK